MTDRESIDANVVLRLLLDDVPEQHATALRLVKSGRRLVVSDIALVETIFVLGRAYGLTRSQQQEAIIGLLSQATIHGDIDVFERSFDLYTKHPKLSFEDCYLATTADDTGAAPLWTFDKKLANQTTARLLTNTAIGYSPTG